MTPKINERGLIRLVAEGTNAQGISFVAFCCFSMYAREVCFRISKGQTLDEINESLSKYANDSGLISTVISHRKLIYKHKSLYNPY